MRRNKLNSNKKKQQNLTRDVRDIYLPRTESSLADILDNFDDIENVNRTRKRGASSGFIG